MAKDSPWFKFLPSEYNDGNITFCSLAAQGLFINICSYYWSREGDLTRTFITRKIKDSTPDLWGELSLEDVVKFDGDTIIIHFLDEQLKDRIDLSNKAKEAIKKRWDDYRAKNQKAPNQAKNTVVSEPYYDQNTAVESPYYDPYTNKKEKEIVEIDTSLSKKERSISTSADPKPPTPARPPLRAALRVDSVVRPEIAADYALEFAELVEAKKIPASRAIAALEHYCPCEIDADQMDQIVKTVKKLKAADVQSALRHYSMMLYTMTSRMAKKTDTEDAFFRGVGRPFWYIDYQTAEQKKARDKETKRLEREEDDQL